MARNHRKRFDLAAALASAQSRSDGNDCPNCIVHMTDLAAFVPSMMQTSLS